MTPDDLVFATGALDSPPDNRDWTMADALALAGVDPSAVPPPVYDISPPLPPVYSQGASPWCVAMGSGASQVWRDMRDTGGWAPDFGRFFGLIGGTPAGAVPRAACQRMLDFGFPELGHPEREPLHRISAYYAADTTPEAIRQAVWAVQGPVLVSLRWPASWNRPVNGVLPAPSGSESGHLVYATGYDLRGLWICNSWTAAWGANGHALIPWAFTGQVREVWKLTDLRLTPPPSARWAVNVAHGAVLMQAHLIPVKGKPPVIASWTPLPYAGRAVSWRCSAPRVLKGQHSGQAVTVRLTAGPHRGIYIRSTSPGVSTAPTA